MEMTTNGRTEEVRVRNVTLARLLYRGWSLKLLPCIVQAPEILPGGGSLRVMVRSLAASQGTKIGRQVGQGRGSSYLGQELAPNMQPGTPDVLQAQPLQASLEAPREHARTG